MTSYPQRLPYPTVSNNINPASVQMYPNNRGNNSTDHYQSETCCSLVIKLLCCINIKRSSRIKIVWLWITSLSVIGGVVTTTMLFGSTTSVTAPTDMRIVDSKVSTLFCSSLKLSSEWTTFSAYLLSTKPGIVFNKLDHFEVRRNKHLDNGEYKYWAFYLLVGSEVTIKSCTHSQSLSMLEVYVIRGKDNLNIWMKNKSCVFCFLKRQIINKTCTYDKVTYTFKADVTGEYYFVYVNRGEHSWLTLQIILERTVYDTTNAKDSCIQTIACSFNFDIDSDEVVVYQITNDDQRFDFDDITIETTCNDRLWIYILIFIIIPLSIGISFCSLIYAVCKDPRSSPRAPHSQFSRRTMAPHPTERSPLLWNQITCPPHPVLPIEPPKYEDVVDVHDTSPPSYEQAIS